MVAFPPEGKDEAGLQLIAAGSSSPESTGSILLFIADPPFLLPWVHRGRGHGSTAGTCAR
jgi:hypothetical protein